MMAQFSYIISEQYEDEDLDQCPCHDRKDILIVDDNVFNIMTLQCILSENLKLDADKAINGREAVEKIINRYEVNEREPC
jgi:PleD family two-component response regulator